MKRFVLAVVALALIGPTPAFSQLEVALGGGILSPTGDYKKEATTGYSITSGLGYRVHPMALVGLEANFAGNGGAEEYVESLGQGWDVSQTTLQVSGIAKFLMPVGRHHVYAKTSVGNYRAATKVTNSNGEFSGHVTDMGYAYGGGVVIGGRSNSSFFVDVAYHSVRLGADHLDTRFLTVHGGATFQFDLFQ